MASSEDIVGSFFSRKKKKKQTGIRSMGVRHKRASDPQKKKHTQNQDSFEKGNKQCNTQKYKQKYMFQTVL